MVFLCTVSPSDEDIGLMNAPFPQDKPQQARNEQGAEVLHPFEFQGDDATLIRGMRENRPGAFRAFYRRHVSLVYAVLLRALGSDEDLENLIQEVFIEAFRGIGKLREADRVKSWLAVVAVNTARDTIKERKRKRWLHFFEPSKLPETPAPSAETADREAVAAVYRVLDALSVDHRIAFTLRYMNEMELLEIADACHVSRATVKRRLAKAEKRFFALAAHQPALLRWIRNE